MTASAMFFFGFQTRNYPGDDSFRARFAPTLGSCELECEGAGTFAVFGAETFADSESGLVVPCNIVNISDDVRVALESAAAAYGADGPVGWYCAAYEW